ncbi:hypothetical protein GWI71_20615, partial [Microvirga tunisiensis]
SYDAQGNLVSEADGAGNTTRYVYDGTYKLFPVEKQLPAFGRDPRHKTLNVWDMVCGLPSSVTDENGAKTTFVYDALCRKKEERLPTGGYVKSNYLSLGDPTKSAIETRTKHATSGEVISRSRIDGFGREVAKTDYGSSTSNPDAITSYVDYDARGNVERKSNPRKSGETSLWTVFSYDGLNRPVKTTMPDGK